MTVNQPKVPESATVFYRDTWAEIDLDAIRENAAAIKSTLPAAVEFMAVVKANGYGHGALETAEEALKAGAGFLGTALLDEALDLRAKGITAPILVLGVTRPQDVPTAAAEDITLTAFQEEWIKEASDALEGTGAVLSLHVKLDSGMNRIGMKSKEEISRFAAAVSASPSIEVTGMYTHLAAADELDRNFTLKQLEQFRCMGEQLEEELGRPVACRHAANSAGTLLYPEAGLNMVRVGISMYGLAPSPAVKPLLPVKLKEAFSLHSRITHVKKLQAGESISYGRTYTASEEEWIATVPIGYADGWIRANQGGDVLVDGKRAPIVGRICMDQMLIKLEHPAAVDTHVTLIGGQGTEFISVEEIAARLETISYEIPCIISARVPRVLKKGGKTAAVHNRVL